MDHDSTWPYDRGRHAEEVELPWREPPPWHVDDRLQHLVFLDGRLVDSWTDSVRGSRWEEHAHRFENEQRPVYRHIEPRRPAHEEVLEWLDGLVGGRESLLAMTDAVAASPEPPTFEDAEQGAVYLAVAELLDRVAGQFFDDEVARVLEVALSTLWQRRQGLFTPAHPANATAGGLCWVVGRANGLFVGGPTQTTIQRELWLRSTLSAVGQRIAQVLRGVALTQGHRPRQAPDLTGFANPALLTPTTRRTLLLWRDQALAAARAAAVLPSEVES
jgi:hypothetical protein